MVDKKYWHKKRVLVTGHTGFKGSWLVMILKELGATVGGISLEDYELHSIYSRCKLEEVIDFCEYLDITDDVLLNNAICEFNPEIIFHLAAQPLVIEGYKDPANTYKTNVIGTLNVLESAKNLSELLHVVVITTDKVYKNTESPSGYQENDVLGGHDPYSSSKAACEILVESYRLSYFSQPDSAIISSVRAGNVIGGGDWSDNRILPDLMRAYKSRSKVDLRSPSASRPWQHVLDPLLGYLLIAQQVKNKVVYYSWNFGPNKRDIKTVLYLSQRVKAYLEYDEDLFRIHPNDEYHETQQLILNIDRANKMLGWSPKFDFDKSIAFTVEWYLADMNESDVFKVSLEQIKSVL